MIQGRKLDQIGVVMNSSRKKQQTISVGSTLHYRKASQPVSQALNTEIVVPILYASQSLKKLPGYAPTNTKMTLSRHDSLQAFTSPNKHHLKSQGLSSPNNQFKVSDIQSPIVSDQRIRQKQSPKKQIINLQQQIIIQQQINTLPMQNEKIRELQSGKKNKPLKKKKKSNKNKVINSPNSRPKRRVDSQDLENHIQVLLGGSIQQFKKKQEHEKVQKEIERQRVTSLQDFKKYMDYEIRRRNNERFGRSRNDADNNQLPWGINQEKLRSYWGKMIQIHQKLKNDQIQQTQVQSQKAKENHRRQDLGLGFLNQLSDSLISHIVEKSKQNQVSHTQQNNFVAAKSPNSISYCENLGLSHQKEQQIKNFMYSKQISWKQKALEEKYSQQIQNQKLRENLRNLEHQISQKKQRQLSINSNRHQSNYSQKKPQDAFSVSEKVLRKQTSQELFMTPKLQMDQQLQVHNDYEKLSQEYTKIFNWRLLQKQSGRTSPMVYPDLHQDIDNQEFIDWLQSLPESFLEQQLVQMQAINQQMNAQGFNYILNEPEQYQFLESFLKEKFKQHKEEIKYQVQTNQVQELSQQPEPPNNTKVHLKFQQQSQHKSLKKDDTQKQLQVINRYSDLHDRWQQAVANNSKEQTPSKLDEYQINKLEESQILAIQHAAATIIQKIWRGYHTRQMVFQYLQYILDQQEQDQEEGQEGEQGQEYSDYGNQRDLQVQEQEEYEEDDQQDEEQEYEQELELEYDYEHQQQAGEGDSHQQQDQQEYDHEEQPDEEELEVQVHEVSPISYKGSKFLEHSVVDKTPTPSATSQSLIQLPQQLQKYLQSEKPIHSQNDQQENSKSRNGLKQVLGAVKFLNPSSSNTYQPGSSASLVTIQALNADIINQPVFREIETTQKPLQQLKMNQMDQWDHLIQQFVSFKQNEAPLSKAVTFFNNMQKQCVQNLNDEDDLKIKKNKEKEIEEKQIIFNKHEKAVDGFTQTEQVETQNAEDDVKDKEEDEEEQTSLAPISMIKSDNSIKDEHDFNINAIQIFNNHEKVLNHKYQEQMRIMEKMLESKKVSKESFSRNQTRLDKRMRRSKDKINAQRSDLEKIQQLFKDTIKQTQKDRMFVEKMKKQNSSFKSQLGDDENMSLRQILSLRSDTEQSEIDIKQQQYSFFPRTKELLIVKVDNSVSSVDQKSSSFDGGIIKQSPSGSPKLHIFIPPLKKIDSLNPQDMQPLYNQKETFLTLEEDEPFKSQPNQLSSNNIFIQTDDLIPQDEEDQIEIVGSKSDNINENMEYITEDLLHQMIEEFASELNQFPISSLGVLMEWDEESESPNQLDVKQVQGFPTTLNFIKEYLIQFSEFIQKSHLAHFLSQINTPLGISAVDLLKTISLSEISASQMDESQSGPLYPLIKHIHMMEPVIEEELWEQFTEEYALQGKLKYALINDTEQTYLKDSEQFHLRMVYEAFNEALNFIRPYGIRGQPYPWKSNPLKVYAHFTDQKNVEKAMGFAISKMLKWGAFLCGFIPEKIETPQGEVILIEEDYLNQIKEDRLQQMLENEIQENEEKWLAYEEELTEVGVELADIVFEMMLDEASEELQQIIIQKSLMN